MPNILVTDVTRLTRRVTFTCEGEPWIVTGDDGIATNRVDERTRSP
jgi:hypothetical protein